MKILTYKTLKGKIDRGDLKLIGSVFGEACGFKYAEVSARGVLAPEVLKVVGSPAGMEAFFGLPMPKPVPRAFPPVKREGHYGELSEYDGPNYPEPDHGQNGPTGHGDICHSDADSGL